jgi:hypothetical protein
MTALFVSYVCDFCDGLRKPARLYHGYVLWQGAPARAGRHAYVFATRDDAERYRSAAGVDPCEIREVVCEYELRWQRSRGSINDVDLAEKLATLFPDHRFEPAPYRVYPAQACA